MLSYISKNKVKKQTPGFLHRTSNLKQIRFQEGKLTINCVRILGIQISNFNSTISKDLCCISIWNPSTENHLPFKVSSDSSYFIRSEKVETSILSSPSSLFHILLTDADITENNEDVMNDESSWKIQVNSEELKRVTKWLESSEELGRDRGRCHVTLSRKEDDEGWNLNIYDKAIPGEFCISSPFPSFYFGIQVEQTLVTAMKLWETWELSSKRVSFGGGRSEIGVWEYFQKLAFQTLNSTSSFIFKELSETVLKPLFEMWKNAGYSHPQQIFDTLLVNPLVAFDVVTGTYVNREEFLEIADETLDTYRQTLETSSYLLNINSILPVLVKKQRTAK